MGTDIHMIVEAKDDEGNWKLVPDPIVECWACNGTAIDTSRGGAKCYYCDVERRISDCHRWMTDPEESKWYLKKELDECNRIIEEKGTGGGCIVGEWYGDRHYDVFAILANVRNGSGFAGVDTGNPWPFIQNGRELPEDACLEVIEYMSHYQHSPGWVTLQEITKYDWDYVRTKRGVVNEAQFREWLLNGDAQGSGPSGWSGAVSGGMVRHITNEEMLELMTGLKYKDPDLSYYTKVQWLQTARDVCEPFIERMKELAKVVGEHECRIHFYFDS